jgi:type VI secretion system FHA domain protein
MPVERPRPVAPAPPPPAPVAATAPPQARAGSGDLAAFLEGAGLPNVPVSPELAQSFGRMFRVVVAGVMDMLRARQQTKGALGIEQTLFKPANNNPLKFSANVDDALHNLLVKRNAAYLGPVEAFEDAFADVKIHQMAMLHGMRVAFEAMLEQFDPDRLEDTFNRQIKKGALVSMPAKLRYWDLYREKMQDMLKDADGSFRELFGDTFAAAYDEQLKRLKSGGRS